jgi:uncharacterized membrane protein
MFWKRKASQVEFREFTVREGRVNIFIESPPNAVWDCLADVANYDKWVRWFTATLPDGQDVLEKPGDYFNYETSILGIKFSGRMMSVERIPPQRSAFILLSPYRGGGEYLLEPMLSGTRVHYTIWSELPSSYMGKLVEQVLVAKKAKENMQDHLDRLKAYVEGLPAP